MLTPEQEQHYRDQGYVLVRGIFSEAECVDMEAEFDGIVERKRSGKTLNEATWQGSWNKKNPKTQIFHCESLQAYSAVWGRVLFHEKLTGAFAGCLGTPNVQLHHTKLFQKPTDKGSGFPMHQDQPYFPHENHSMMAGIIHLTDATEDMGCVRVYPGSHKLGPLPCWEHNYLNPEEYPIEKATPCPAKRGDVLFFNYLTVHGSGLNTSDRVRKTVLIQVRDPEDKPVEDRHLSHAQGLMMRGIDPGMGTDKDFKRSGHERGMGLDQLQKQKSAG